MESMKNLQKLLIGVPGLELGKVVQITTQMENTKERVGRCNKIVKRRR